MYCYVLQGLLGVAALAVLLGIALGIVWVLMKVEKYIPEGGGRFGETILKWIAGPIIGAGALFAIANFVWLLGGSALHQFFRFCVGGP